ncbi:MAG: hypothetical protein IT279_11655 [Ignavibacteriaceae bacterium]|nr:hypothetical protein [Ignavibacteriaceae bacterium]
MQNEILPRYLRKYRKIEHPLGMGNNDRFDIAIIVPIKNEHPHFQETILSLLEADSPGLTKIAVIGVVNNSTEDTDDIKENNRQSLLWLKTVAEKTAHRRMRITWIDAALQNPLDPKDAGVGLARKIGMDEALTRLSDPLKGLLVCLDADCTVNKEYLTSLETEYLFGGFKAGVARFEHRTEELADDHLRAILSYELYIRLYAAGALYAGSHYSYLPVGSTIITSGAVYMQAEGMNKRKAAEDFYFLEKVAKFTPVKIVYEAVVYPSARISRRVPFGTGPAVDDMLKGKRNPDMIYNPKIFDYLSDWLKVFMTPTLLSKEEYLEAAKGIHPGVYDYLSTPVISRELGNFLAHSKPGEYLTIRKRNWFDALKTLRMVHTIRDGYLPDIPIDDALKKFAVMIGVIHPEHSPDKSKRLQKQLEWIRVIKP